MDIFTILCSFVGDWLLFIFPLYQGKMELMESNTVFAKYQSSVEKKRKVPTIYWLFPPLLFHYYKKNAHTQLKNLATNSKDLKNFYSFYNKGLAWYFVAYAGFLNSINSSYELIEKFELEKLGIVLTLVICLLGFLFGNHYVDYLCSKKRHQRFIKNIATNIISDKIAKKNANKN